MANSYNIITELANAGEFDKDMMEGTRAKIKTEIKKWSCCSKALQGNLFHQEADTSISAISMSPVSKQKNESTPTRSISLLYPKCRKKCKEINYSDKSKCRKKL
jgi:hypothetical protein